MSNLAHVKPVGTRVRYPFQSADGGTPTWRFHTAHRDSFLKRAVVRRLLETSASFRTQTKIISTREQRRDSTSHVITRSGATFCVGVM